MSGIILVAFYLCAMIGYYLYGRIVQNKKAISFAKELFLGFIGVLLCLFIVTLWIFLFV